jgi:hypothetical protein
MGESNAYAMEKSALNAQLNEHSGAAVSQLWEEISQIMAMMRSRRHKC